MIRVFISFAKPDKEAAETLKRRLEASGVDCWLSPEDIQVGDNWLQEIQKGISQCDAGVVLMSDAAFEHSDWVKFELGGLFGAGKKIFPLKPGPLAKVPSVIKDTQVEDLQKGDQYEAQLERLIGKLFQAAGKNQPTRLYCALLAMTSDQFAQAVAGPLWAKVENFLTGLGLTAADIQIEMGARYQLSTDAFEPFEVGRPLMAVLEEQIRSINPRRVAAKLPPFHVRWCHQELMAGDKAIRPRLQGGNALLIIDSVSTCHPGVLACVDSSVPLVSKGGLIWIPPYTRRLASLEDRAAKVIENSIHAWDVYNAVKDGSLPADPLASKPWAAFDVGHKSAFLDWVYRLVAERSEAADPGLREAMSKTNQSILSPRMH